MSELKQRKRHFANTIINHFKDFSEVVIYKKDFMYTTGNYDYIDEETGVIEGLNNNEINKARKFMKDKKGVLHPLYDVSTIDILQRTINKSCRRAKDNFYGYALSNTWQYFLTLIIDSNTQSIEDDLIIDLWDKFRKRLYKINPDVKVLGVPERHTETETKKLHFHCLVGNIDLSKFMTLAINPHTNEPIISKYGQQVYNINGLWKYGFNTLVEIKQEETQLQVVNYLIGYTTKANNVGYCNKKYYRTRNLEFKNKELFLLSSVEKKELCDGAEQHKENDRMIVYRIYKK